MEENQKFESSITDQPEGQKEENTKKCEENTCRLKCLAILCAAFLGGFIAMFFAAEKYFSVKTYRIPYGNYINEDKIFKELQRQNEKEMRELEQIFERQNIRPGIKPDNIKLPPFFTSPVKIKTETEDDKYNIIVSLKPFHNDSEKIKYNIKDGIINVFGNCETVKNHMTTKVSFSQDFILPENTDIKNITKIKSGDKLIISIPMKD